jgi:hypothetical protein
VLPVAVVQYPMSGGADPSTNGGRPTWTVTEHGREAARSVAVQVGVGDVRAAVERAARRLDASNAPSEASIGGEAGSQVPLLTVVDRP